MHLSYALSPGNKIENSKKDLNKILVANKVTDS